MPNGGPDAAADAAVRKEYDETIYPVDHARSGQIRDFSLFNHFVRPMRSGVTVTCVMDCCHSGSVLDLPYSYRPTPSGEIRSRRSMDALGGLACMHILSGGMVPPDGLFGPVLQYIEHVTGESVDSLQGIMVEDMMADVVVEGSNDAGDGGGGAARDDVGDDDRGVAGTDDGDAGEGFSADHGDYTRAGGDYGGGGFGEDNDADDVVGDGGGLMEAFGNTSRLDENNFTFGRFDGNAGGGDFGDAFGGDNDGDIDCGCDIGDIIGNLLEE
jgi:hypothetical protein